MKSIESTATLPDSNIRFDKVSFFAALAVATVFPILFNIIFNKEDSVPIGHVFTLLAIMSTMHVGLTGYFFYDKEYRAKMSREWKFYYLLPAVLIVLLGSTTWVYGKVAENYIWVFYHAWLLWHYGRQNLGILAFTAIVTKSGKLNKLERLALNLAPIGALIAAYGVTSHVNTTILFGIKSSFYSIGLVLYTLALISAATAFALHFKKGAHSLRAGFALLLPLFFVTTFLFDSYSEAVMGYAIAHGVQYFIFMFFLASGSEGSSKSNILALAGISTIGWFIILATREQSWWGNLSPFIPGAALALIMWHFIVDSGLWRLRNKWQRDQVTKRFDFLFH